MKQFNLFLLALITVAFFSCKNDSNKTDIESKINQLYAKQESIYGKEPDANLFSKPIVESLKNVQNITKADAERIKNSNSPSDKPVMLEGSVFTSMYDGFAKYTIGEITVTENATEAAVSFESNGTPKETWTDKVLLVNENGWKIDNVVFTGKNVDDKDLKGRLASVKAVEETPNNVDASAVYGTYEGEIPCADCSGILQNLTLNKDNTYILKSTYKGKGDGKPFTDKGTFTIENNRVKLSIKDAPSQYLINKSYLEQLDMVGNKIEGSHNYKLSKK